MKHSNSTNISTILNNIKSSLFEDVQFHYTDKSSKSEKNIAKRTKLRKQGLDEIAKKEEKISFELFEKHFSFQKPIDMLKTVYDTNDEKNINLVNVIKSGLSDLEVTQKMIEKEKKNEKPTRQQKLLNEF